MCDTPKYPGHVEADGHIWTRANDGSIVKNGLILNPDKQWDWDDITRGNQLLKR